MGGRAQRWWLPTDHRRRENGFTLIELLVVAAIVAILAAIAVPNLMQASIRARVARVLADQRTLATALEAYATDANGGRYAAYGNPRDYALAAGEPVVFAPVLLTTPVAYLSVLPSDGFPGRRTGLDAAAGPTTYFYMHDYEIVYLGKWQESGHVTAHFQALTGQNQPRSWTLWSFGPDGRDDHGIRLYDATNGTISPGDLQRFGP